MATGIVWFAAHVVGAVLILLGVAFVVTVLAAMLMAWLSIDEIRVDLSAVVRRGFMTCVALCVFAGLLALCGVIASFFSHG